MPAQTAPARLLSVSVGVQCHPGNVRTENQDRISRSSTPFGDLYVVADGVGGYQDGAEAAQATVHGFTRELAAHADLPLADALEAAAQAINRELEQRAQAQNPPVKMSSTVVIALLQGATATLAHIGDSRAYLVRGGKLQQITRDHSVMQRLIDQGDVGVEEAEQHPSASVLTQALGQAEDVRLEISKRELLPGDALLLCSDGLWGYTTDAEMEAVADSRGLSAEACADTLLQLALQGGGGDNISIQYLKFSARQAPLRRRQIFGLSPGVALLAGTCLTLLAAAAAGLTTWNYFHGTLPAQAGEIAAAGTYEIGRAAALADLQGSPAVVSVIHDGEAEAHWANRLPKLAYVEVVSVKGCAACLAWEKDRDTLYYNASKEAAAIRIRRDLGLASEDMAQWPSGNQDCGAGDLFAFPARRSLPHEIHKKGGSAATSVEDGLKRFYFKQTAQNSRFSKAAEFWFCNIATAPWGVITGDPKALSSTGVSRIKRSPAR